MKSMTGYGAAEGKVGHGTIFVELKAVNHRYCDLQLKIPPKFNVLDPRMRKVIQSRIGRGKIDLFMKEKRDIAPTPHVAPNVALARAYARCLQQLARELRGVVPPLLEVIDLRELVIVQEPPVRYERFWRAISTVIGRALRQLEHMRRAEGAHIKRDQMTRLHRLEGLVRRIGRMASQVVRTQRRHWEGQTGTDMALPMDVARAETLSRAMAERLEITEEITRLQSHVRQYRRYCSGQGPIGRQLDFLLQEMNREINTIGSKANHAEISQLVVESKSELEKLREQVQNIE